MAIVLIFARYQINNYQTFGVYICKLNLILADIYSFYISVWVLLV